MFPRRNNREAMGPMGDLFRRMQDLDRRMPNGHAHHEHPLMGPMFDRDIDEFFEMERRMYMHGTYDEDDFIMEDILQGHCERVKIDGDVLSYTGGDEDDDPGTFIAKRQITTHHNYVEIEILDAGTNAKISLGVTPRIESYHQSKQDMPGIRTESIIYHCNKGKLKQRTSKANQVLSVPRCYMGDRVGVGYVHEPNAVPPGPGQKPVYSIFFTKNGKKVESVHTHMMAGGFFPLILIHSEGAEVRYSQDMDYNPRSEENIQLMSIDDCEEDWSRLHDIKLNGHILEYTGKGKSILDVGLAQAKLPLDTTCHYFEIEIVDPGENCYIAIGMARKTYPNYRHPGWNKGSVAYHADDGKLFAGSGMGAQFGPKCHRGDVMGCGILFPVDYNSESDQGHGNDNDLRDLPESDDEEEDEMRDALWMPHEYRVRQLEETGTKVQVFFTRNGKTIGSKEVHIPQGGFYPTVGMLSSHEKVRVDLRPLTG